MGGVEEACARGNLGEAAERRRQQVLRDLHADARHEVHHRPPRFGMKDMREMACGHADGIGDFLHTQFVAVFRPNVPDRLTDGLTEPNRAVADSSMWG